MENDEIVLIVFYGRSGSFFIHSLLDGHDDVVSIPPYIQEYFKNELVNTSSLDVDEAWSVFCSKFGFIIGLDDYKYGGIDKKVNLEGMNIDLSDIDFTSYKCFFYSYYLELNKTFSCVKSLFLAINYAHHSCVKGKFFSIPSLEKKKFLFQLHAPDIKQIEWYKEHFKSVKVIQMLRRPIETLRSLVFHHYEDGYISNELLFNLMRQVLFGGFSIPIVGVDHIGVRLEDLHQSPIETMKKLAIWLDLEWSDTLIKSTFLGKEWVNVKGREHKSGFHSEHKRDDIGDLISDIDQLALDGLMYDKNISWGYEYSSLTKKDSVNHLVNNPTQLEYIPIFNNLKLSKEAYESGKSILRCDKIKFLYEYASIDNKNWVNVL